RTSLRSWIDESSSCRLRLSGLIASSMQPYKTQLWRRLEEHGWEVVEVIESDEWWADEFWKVQSRRNQWGYEIVLTFLVDPMWEGPGQKSNAVWAVSVTEDLPSDRFTAEQSLPERILCMVKGRFDKELEAFVACLDAHRNRRATS